MKIIPYVPPHEVAREAREARARYLASTTPEERWQRLLDSGLIHVMKDGTVRTCYYKGEFDDEENGVEPSDGEPRADDQTDA